MRTRLILMALLLLSPSAAAARTVAVLEFRAGARGAQGVAAGLAEQLTRLTSNQVVSPADARRRIGPSLDARVARCAGDPSCLARIGGDLDCDEVLMVGDWPERDIAGARNLKIPTALAKYGAVFDISDSGADYVLESVDQILPLLNRINEERVEDPAGGGAP